MVDVAVDGQGDAPPGLVAGDLRCPAGWVELEFLEGRTGVFEVMPVTREIRELISENRPTREIRDKAISQKMLQTRDAALLKVARGETSTEEVFRAIPSEHLLDD